MNQIVKIDINVSLKFIFVIYFPKIQMNRHKLN